MKQLLPLFLMVIALIGCGGSDEDEVSEEEHVAQLQETAYSNVKNNIVGDWHAARFYNDGTYSDYWGKPTGWIDITSSEVVYSFNSDGTFSEVNVYDKTVSGTYKIYKNSYYLEAPNYTVATYIEFDYQNHISPTVRGITITNGYMRLYSTYELYGTEYVSFEDYPANYMYAK